MPVPSNWRWLWHDPVLNEDWRVPRNPNRMTSPQPIENVETLGRLADSRPLALVRRGSLTEWQFGGKIYTQDHHDTLLEWTGPERDYPIHITTHLGETWEVKILRHEFTENASGRHPWKFTYTITANVIRRVS